MKNGNESATNSIEELMLFLKLGQFKVTYTNPIQDGAISAALEFAQKNGYSISKQQFDGDTDTDDSAPTVEIYQFIRNSN